MPATTSSAILRGGLRRFRASSKASGVAYSPSSTAGGCSMTIFGKSTPYALRRKSRKRCARRCSRACYKGPSKLVNERATVANQATDQAFDEGCVGTYEEKSDPVLCALHIA